jgi:ubiquinol-cytochrome c reductase cytochrome c subunit
MRAVRRRGGRGLTPAVLLLAGVGVTAVLAGTPAAAGPASTPTIAPTPTTSGPTGEQTGPPLGDAGHGLTLYQQNCASCHGQRGEGSQRGPSLIGVGAAAADFYLRTGRMPLAQEEPQAKRGKPKFGDSDIADLDAFVASLAAGPSIPSVSPGEVTTGRKLYLQECAACHGASGVGYTQVGGRTAPSVLQSTPQEIAEAVRVGPNTMPQFPENVLDEEQVNSIVSYVAHLQQVRVQDQGGANLGSLGPVTETLVGFAGVAVLLVVIRLMGKRAPGKRAS